MSGLLSKFSDTKRVITTTSRKPRDGEKDGVDYNFISESDFKQKINQGDFIEYVSYAGNLYGTEKSQIINNLNHNLIWRIDPSRSGQIREFIKDAFSAVVAEDLLKKAVVVYLTVDNRIVLERLAKRGLSKEEIDKRMQEDARFWHAYHEYYDFVVENIPGELDGTIDKIIQILENRLS